MVRTIMNTLLKKLKITGVSDRELLTWAKTEYGNDWAWAYDFMINNPGQSPKHTRGVTL